MTFNPGVIIRMTEIEKAAIEFFGWFNKTYPQHPSDHPDHPWNQLGMAICNRDLAGQEIKLEPGWLQKQMDETRAEVAKWPECFTPLLSINGELIQCPTEGADVLAESKGETK